MGMGRAVRRGEVAMRTGAHAGDGVGWADHDGFTLIEVVVALTLTVVVMTATAGFFIRGLAATRLMQQRQSAVAVAELAMERVRAEPVAAISIGRDVTFSGSTHPEYRVSNIDYTVRTRITACGIPPTPPGGSCGTDLLSPNLVMYRVVVDVSWTPRSAAKCSGIGGMCEYSLTTLRDASPRSVENLTEIPQ